MKITCFVEIHNYHVTSGQKIRPVRCCLAIGTKNGTGETYLLLSHAQNRTGTHYKIKSNVAAIFSKFIVKGKTTLRFKEPSHDLCISGDPLKLQSFIKMIHTILNSQEQSEAKDNARTNEYSAKPLPSQQSVNDMLKPKKTLTITKKSDYPPSDGFSTELEILKINAIDLRKLDNRMSSLKNLRILDLSGNHLTNITALANMPGLLELYVNDNNLKIIEAKFFQGVLKTTLRVLDVSDNQLELLPNAICHMGKLNTLKARRNRLTDLPRNIGQLTSLKFLYLSENELTVLPSSCFNWHLDYLDLSSNNFISRNREYLQQLDLNKEEKRISILSLKEIAASVVLINKMHPPFGSLPATLHHFLDCADWCVCGRACFNPSLTRLVKINLNQLAGSVCHDSQDVFYQIVYCSLCCYPGRRTQRSIRRCKETNCALS